MNDDFHGAVANLLKGTKDLLRQLTVGLVYEPIGLLKGDIHFLFSYGSRYILILDITDQDYDVVLYYKLNFFVNNIN